MKIIFSKECLNYEFLSHPESAQRVKNVYLLLKKHSFGFIHPQLCSREDILLVHNNKLLQMVKKADFFDPDTPCVDGIYKYARLAAGGAIKAAELAIKEGRAFALVRPPGHHADKTRLGGFCYFNNIAIAVKKIKSRIKKIAIIDIDGHHGNGTEDIFLGNEGIVYVSLHQQYIYPGTGLVSRENCLNFPLLAGTGEKDYLRIMEEAVKKIRDFNPDLIAVSAGFDAYRKDCLTGLSLDINTYKEIGKKISLMKKPSFAVLEGGYSEDIAQCVYQFLVGFDQN